MLPRPEVSTARRLRAQMSLPEVLLWRHLRGGKAGAKFRRQHPIGPYVSDFCALAEKIVIEIDGIAHNMGTRPTADAERTAFLEQRGFRVIRIASADVLADVEGIAAGLARTVSPLRQSLRDCHLPMNGEDLR